VGKKKLIRFAENLTFSHLFQYSYEELVKGFPYKGKWRRDFFHNENPITLELGCGKGEYTVFLARKYPYRNFIGIDIKGARLWKGCKESQDEKLNNVAFIRTRVQLVSLFFEPGEISQIWITFPDPQPRKAKENKRLTSPEFLNHYRDVLAKDGVIHLKTDSEDLFDYTLKVIELGRHELLYSDRDIYHSGYEGDASAIRTFYEEMFLADGVPIKYLQFRLNDER
jgi:tRNA (guanine-N7-)-methyltransferase